MRSLIFIVLTSCSAWSSAEEIRWGFASADGMPYVEVVEQHDAQAAVTKDGMTVSGDSIMGLLMLGAGIGCQIEVSAEGSDAQEAIEALTDLVARKFDEDQ